MRGFAAVIAALGIGLGAHAQVTWKGDVSKERIPGRTASGRIHGQSFKVEKAEITQSTGSNSAGKSKYEFPTYTLTLRQGKEFFADREFLLFLATPRGRSLDGFTIKTAPYDFLKDPWERRPGHQARLGDTTFYISHIQSVHMSWSEPRSSLPKTEMFMDKFSINLRFGKRKGDRIPGEIFLTVPDKSKSFVAGRFEASIRRSR